MIWLSHPLAALSKSDALVVTDWLKSQCVVPNHLRANVSAMATLQAFLNADRPRVMLLPAEFSAHSNANTRVRVPRCTRCDDIFVLLFAVDAHPILTANIVCGFDSSIQDVWNLANSLGLTVFASSSLFFSKSVNLVKQVWDCHDLKRTMVLQTVLVMNMFSSLVPCTLE
jgi:hypothetical protein